MTGIENHTFPRTYKDVQSNYIFMFLLLIVWPFGAFLYSLYNYNERESKVILILFTALLCYSMVAESSGLDLYRVFQLLPEAYQQNLVHYLENRSVHESVDIYRDAITFLVSRFTSNPKWLMLFFGIFAGYAYTKVLALFITEYPGKNIYTLLLVLIFSCIIGIDSIAGVRFGLAAYVFFYGAIKVILGRDNRYLFVAASSILIHFSFLSTVLILLIFVFLKLERYPVAIYFALCLSYIIPDLIHSYIVQYSGLFGGGIKARTELYSNLEEDLDMKNAVWFVRLRILVMMVFCYLVLFFTRFKKKTLQYSNELEKIFFFSLVILIFVNFTMDIPHFGYRFQFIFILFVYFYLYKIYMENSKSILTLRLIQLSIPFSLLLVIYTIRSTLSITSLSLYYVNFIALFFDHPVSSAWTNITSFHLF